MKLGWRKLFLALVILNVLDLASTAVALSTPYFEEANQLAKKVFEFGGIPAMLAMKTIALFISWNVFLVVNKKGKEISKKFGFCALIAANGIYLGAVASNINQLWMVLA